jgi:hypothetical protein
MLDQIELNESGGEEKEGKFHQAEEQLRIPMLNFRRKHADH